MIPVPQHPDPVSSAMRSVSSLQRSQHVLPAVESTISFLSKQRNRRCMAQSAFLVELEPAELPPRSRDHSRRSASVMVFRSSLARSWYMVCQFSADFICLPALRVDESLASSRLIIHSVLLDLLRLRRPPTLTLPHKGGGDFLAFVRLEKATVPSRRDNLARPKPISRPQPYPSPTTDSPTAA